jgi:hypothetical protein
MRKPMKFRCRETGQILNERQVRTTRSSNAFRFTTDESGQRKVRPMILTFPRTPEQWADTAFLNAAALDLVSEDARPSDTETYTWELGEPVLRDGQWMQPWLQIQKFSSLDEWRAFAMKKIAVTASARRSAGVTIGGVGVRTDEKGIAMLTAAVQVGGNRTWVSGGTVALLSEEDVIRMRDAVAAYIQGCFDREADLIVEVQGASTMQPLALDEGWPDANL